MNFILDIFGTSLMFLSACMANVWLAFAVIWLTCKFLSDWHGSQYLDTCTHQQLVTVYSVYGRCGIFYAID